LLSGAGRRRRKRERERGIKKETNNYQKQEIYKRRSTHQQPVKEKARV